MQNPLAKQNRIEQDCDGRLYLIRKVSKSKDFSIDFGEGGRSRIQILQALIWRKIRKRLLLGCSIRSYLAKWSNMWSSSIFTAIFGKEKSLESFCFKTFSVVEATGLEPTTFWSLRHNRKFFVCFPSVSKSFVSATDTFLYSCSHCFHVVQIRKWSNMWSFRLQVKNGCNKLKTTYPCTYSFVCW